MSGAIDIPAFLRGNTPPCAEPVGANVTGRGLPRAGANGGMRCSQPVYGPGGSSAGAPRNISQVAVADRTDFSRATIATSGSDGAADGGIATQRVAADATHRELIPSPQDRGLASVCVGGIHQHSEARLPVTPRPNDGAWSGS